MIMNGVNYSYPRVWNPVDDVYYNGSSFARAIKPIHTPTLLESYGKTPASVDASNQRWLDTLQDVIDFGIERKAKYVK